MDIIEQLEARRASVVETKERILEQITEAFEPHRKAFDARLSNIVTENSSRRVKVFKLQQIMSDVREFTTPHVPCQKGCSNCCYIRVEVSQVEADAIGQRIGRAAVQLKPTHRMPEKTTFNKSTPCTFLKDGLCSIYDVRPLSCRNAVNLDVDNLLCSFENLDLANARDPRAVGIHYMGMGPIQFAYNRVSAGAVFGDIRDFFPKV